MALTKIPVTVYVSSDPATPTPIPLNQLSNVYRLVLDPKSPPRDPDGPNGKMCYALLPIGTINGQEVIVQIGATFVSVFLSRGFPQDINDPSILMYGSGNGGLLLQEKTIDYEEESRPDHYRTFILKWYDGYWYVY